MTLKVNGERVELTLEKPTLNVVLDELGYSSPYLAVAVNCSCIPRNERASTWLRENDEVEILSPQQGG